MSSSRPRAPCGACKFLRRKCNEQCVFAPYFRPDQIDRFECIHKVYGATKATELINAAPENMREEAVSSLVYEAKARVRDPVHGCPGHIRYLEGRVMKLQSELHATKLALATYKSPQDIYEDFNQRGSSSGQHNQELYEVEEISEQDFLGNLEANGHKRRKIQHQQHQHDDQDQQPEWMELFYEYDRRFRGAGPSGLLQPQLKERLPFMQLPFKKRLMQPLRQLHTIVQQQNQPSNNPQPPQQQKQQ